MDHRIAVVGGLLLGELHGPCAVLEGLHLAEVVREIVGLVDYHHRLRQGNPDPLYEAVEDLGHEHERIWDGDDVRLGHGVLQKLVGTQTGILTHAGELLRLRMTGADEVHPLIDICGFYPLIELAVTPAITVSAFVLRAELGYLLGSTRGKIGIIPHHGACGGRTALDTHTQNVRLQRCGLAYDLFLL